jgi:hypothetical protein
VAIDYSCLQPLVRSSYVYALWKRELTEQLNNRAEGALKGDDWYESLVPPIINRCQNNEYLSTTD